MLQWKNVNDGSKLRSVRDLYLYKVKQISSYDEFKKFFNLAYKFTFDKERECIREDENGGEIGIDITTTVSADYELVNDITFELLDIMVHKLDEDWLSELEDNLPEFVIEKKEFPIGNTVLSDFKYTMLLTNIDSGHIEMLLRYLDKEFEFNHQRFMLTKVNGKVLEIHYP